MEEEEGKGRERRCQVEVCVVATLSQRECVGESVTNAEVRCVQCKGQMYMQVDTLPQLSPLCDPPDKTKKLTAKPVASDNHLDHLGNVDDDVPHQLG